MLRTPRLPAFLLLALTAACGDSGTGPEDQIPTTVVIENEPITLTEFGATEQLTVTVLDQDGNPIGSPATTFESNVPAVATVSGSGLVTAVASGAATVTVRSGQVSADIAVSVDLPPLPLEAGTPVTISGSTLSQHLFSFEVPEGSEGRIIEFRISGGTGDADLRVRREAEPTFELFDCASLLAAGDLDNLDFCALRSPPAGTWYVHVLGVTDISGVQLQVDLIDPIALVNGVSLNGLSAPTAGVLYFTVDIGPVGAPPSGAGAQASLAEGTLTIATEGGTGDVDLFATPLGLFELDIIGDLPCASFQVGNSDSCSITDPSNGTWSVALLAYEAFAGVSLTSTFTAGQGGG